LALVAEANRIFGFDGWGRETVNSNCVYAKQIGQRYCAAYVTRVRIIVRAGEDRVIREACGAGESNASSPGQAHEFAAKAAETDATKRALSTFGNAFGLSLYGGSSDTRPEKSNTTNRHTKQCLDTTEHHFRIRKSGKVWRTEEHSGCRANHFSKD
jgi:recombination DNA repair RAD52 pathway protein